MYAIKYLSICTYNIFGLKRKNIFKLIIVVLRLFSVSKRGKQKCVCKTLLFVVEARGKEGLGTGLAEYFETKLLSKLRHFLTKGYCCRYTQNTYTWALIE